MGEIELQNHDTVWRTLEGRFDGSKPRRFIEGVAVSSSKKCEDDVELVVKGYVELGLAIPLLLNHDCTYPLGRIVRLNVCTKRDQIAFKAELVNDGRLFWAEQAWQQIIAREVTAVSINAKNLRPDVDGVYSRWTAEEVSVIGRGADAGARITRVTERASTVAIALDGAPSETVHWVNR